MKTLLPYTEWSWSEMEIGLDRRHLLANHWILECLSERELDRVLKFSRVRKIPRNKRIFERGDPGHELMAIISGSVKVTNQTEGGKEVLHNILLPGEIFGTDVDCPLTVAAVHRLPIATNPTIRATRYLSPNDGTHLDQAGLGILQFPKDSCPTVQTIAITRHLRILAGLVVGVLNVEVGQHADQQAGAGVA